MVLLHESHATGRGPDYVVVRPEKLFHPERHLRCLALEAGICHRLPATGLVERVIHLHTEMLEELVGSYAHFGVHRIDIARNK